MLTIRQNLLETIHGGNPDRFVNQYEFLKMVSNPGSLHDPRPVKGGPAVVNSWGVTRIFPDNAPGGFPVHTPDKVVIKDITRWKEYVHAPSVIWPEAEWEAFQKQAEAIDRNEYFVTAMVAPGIFENCHHLGEIQNTLMNLYEEPEHMHDLIKYLTEYEIKLAEQIISHIHPDALFHHDDWGTQASTFMSKDMFDEFYLEPYKEVYGFYKQNGVELIVHHSDSYAATLVPSMIEIGIDIFQGCLDTNNIPELIKKYGGKISFMGGINSAYIDHADWSREEIAAIVKKVCDENGKHYFIPCNTMGGPSSLYDGAYDCVTEEIAKYDKVVF